MNVTRTMSMTTPTVRCVRPERERRSQATTKTNNFDDMLLVLVLVRVLVMVLCFAWPGVSIGDPTYVPSYLKVPLFAAICVSLLGEGGALLAALPNR